MNNTGSIGALFFGLPESFGKVPYEIVYYIGFIQGPEERIRDKSVTYSKTQILH